MGKFNKKEYIKKNMVISDEEADKIELEQSKEPERKFKSSSTNAQLKGQKLLKNKI